MKAFAALALPCFLLRAPVPQSREVPLERQIRWQRSLEDAQAIAKAESRPILVVVNMDGESASERIVRERYRDPAWVAMTRPVTCIVASAFRHTPRDHDDQGRRIACPRLGEVTCAEHIALEPVLYDAYLGGERIAPRHALILPDGTKAFDLFLLFDLRELDKKLAESAKLAPPPSPSRPRRAALLEGAGARDHRGRLDFEERVLADASAPHVDEALDALGQAGDAGSIEVLRILVARGVSGPVAERVGAIAERLGLGAPLAAAVRERLMGAGAYPGAPGLGEDAALLPLLDAGSPATRSLLIAYWALGTEEDREPSGKALRLLLGAAEVERVVAAIAKEGGPLDLEEASSAKPGESRPKPAEELPSAEALERELEDLDAALKQRPDDPDLFARYGRTSLRLARRRMEAGVAGAEFLLQDAEHWLARAAEKRPKDASVLIERARTAYYLGKFEEEERLGHELAGLGPRDLVEAQRWIGDACARLLATRSGGDSAVEATGIARGARALAAVVASPDADETDWISLSSFLGALGMRREELAYLQFGVERLPESNALRQALNGRLWSMGRIDLAPFKADWIAGRHPESGACIWYAGYAHLLAAEDLRRGEQPDLAIEAYARASERFRKAIELAPQIEASSRHYLALCALGRGFAHLLAERQAAAAKSLVEAIGILPAVASARDGLDREAIDLLDGALEWRESGRSPVDPVALLQDLEAFDPGNAAWARAVADSELREALRAEGRGDPAEIDRYLESSITAARRAVAVGSGDDDRRTLAQSLAVLAELRLQRKDAGGAREPLAEAAVLLGEAAPALDADLAALESLAATLRERLGAARPRFRPGR